MSYKVIYSKTNSPSPKKVISFSLYGEKSQYFLGAENNIKVAKKLMPDWTCRFYCRADVPNLDKLKTFAELGLCEVFVLDSEIYPMYWRYFAADDPTISYVSFRDCDSIIDNREVAAVDAWLKSGKKLHTMHDCSAGHWSPVMGGMCGLALPISLNIVKSINDWCKNLRNYKFNYSDDQSFLSKTLLPLLEYSHIDHHNDPPKSKVPNSVPFPAHEKNLYSDFVGARTSPFKMQLEEYMQIKSDKAYVVTHLGPGDHFVVRECLQGIIKKYKHVVLAHKEHSLNDLLYMFGGYDHVDLELCSSDNETFNLYYSKYKQSHKFIGLGSHGPKIGEGRNRSWGALQSFEQAGLNVTENTFEPHPAEKFDPSKLSHNLKKIFKQQKHDISVNIGQSSDQNVKIPFSNINKSLFIVSHLGESDMLVNESVLNDLSHVVNLISLPVTLNSAAKASQLFGKNKKIRLLPCENLKEAKKLYKAYDNDHELLLLGRHNIEKPLPFNTKNCILQIQHQYPELLKHAATSNK